MGEEQKNEYLIGYAQYQKINKFMEEGKYNDAQVILDVLSDKHNENYLLSWKYAICLFELGKYSDAEKYYKKAQNERPFLLKEQAFVTKYGETLYQLKEYEKSSKYLQASININENQELTSKAEDLLKNIIDIQK